MHLQYWFWVHRKDLCKLIASCHRIIKNVNRFKKKWSEEEIEFDKCVSTRLVKMTMILYWLIIIGPWLAPLALLLYYEDLNNIGHICLMPVNFMLDLIFEFTIPDSLENTIIFGTAIIVSIGAWMEIRIMLLQYMGLVSVGGFFAGWIIYIIKHKFR